MKLVENYLLTDGRVRGPNGHISLPEQRLVSAAHSQWEDADDFRTAPFRACLDVFNPLLVAASLEPFHRRDWLQDWCEVNGQETRRMMRWTLRFGVLCSTPIRSEDVAIRIADSLIPEGRGCRFFCSHEPEPPSPRGVLVGEAISGHTFEFALFVLSMKAVTLFLSWEED